MEFSKTNNVFIIADDLGLHKSVNEGIFFALKNGLINGASLMANSEAFDDAVIKLKELPSANIGIHMVLVEEKSLLDKNNIPSLVDNNGLMHKNHRVFFIKYVLGLIKKKEIEKELEAQMEKIINAGINPKFINSHQHLHLLPGIIDITIKLAKKYNIPYIRIVNESLVIGGRLTRKIQLLFLRILSSLAAKKIKKNNLICNDAFVGFLNAGNLKNADIAHSFNLIDKNPHWHLELGCHPGFEDGEGIAKYAHWKYNWEKELDLLKKVTPKNKDA